MERGPKQREARSGHRTRHRNRTEQSQIQFQTPDVEKMVNLARLGKTPPAYHPSSWSGSTRAYICLITHYYFILQSNDLDSITLGQLKAMVNSAPKPKARTSLPFNPDYTS